MLQSMGSQRVGHDLPTEQLKILNLITSAKFLLPRKVTYSGVQIRMSLGTMILPITPNEQGTQNPDPGIQTLEPLTTITESPELGSLS